MTAKISQNQARHPTLDRAVTQAVLLLQDRVRAVRTIERIADAHVTPAHRTDASRRLSKAREDLRIARRDLESILEEV